MAPTIENVWNQGRYGQRMEMRRKMSKEIEKRELAHLGLTPGQVSDFVFRYDDHCFSISALAAEAGSASAARFKSLPKRKQTGNWLPKWKFPATTLTGQQPPRTVGETVKFRVGTDKSKPWQTGTVTNITKFGIPLRCKANDPPKDEAMKTDGLANFGRPSALAEAGRSTLSEVTLKPSSSAPELPPRCPLPGVTEGINRLRAWREFAPPRTDERLLPGAAGISQYRRFQYENPTIQRRTAAFLTEAAPPLEDQRPISPPGRKEDYDMADFRDDGSYVIGCNNDGVTLLGEHQIPMHGIYRWHVDLMALPSGGGAFVGIMEDSPDLDPAVHLVGANPFQQRVLLVRDRIQAAGVYFWRDDDNTVLYAILQTVWLPKAAEPTEDLRLAKLELPPPDECLRLTPEHGKLVKLEGPKPKDAQAEKIKKRTRNPEVFDKIRAGLEKMKNLHATQTEPEDLQLTDETKRVGASPVKQYGSVTWERVIDTRPVTPAESAQSESNESDAWKQEPGCPVFLTFESYGGLTVSVAGVQHKRCEAITGIRARPACGFSHGVCIRACHAIGAPHKAGLSYQG